MRFATANCEAQRKMTPCYDRTVVKRDSACMDTPADGSGWIAGRYMPADRDLSNSHLGSTYKSLDVFEPIIKKGAAHVVH